jgi:flavin reductase (DIM6/NTAB) family NADH-FMN oxidoreductase RutF
VALECRAAGETNFGVSTVVFGQVVHVAVAREALGDDGLPDPTRLDPVARIGGEAWAGLGGVFTLRRVPYEEWSAQ